MVDSSTLLSFTELSFYDIKGLIKEIIEDKEVSLSPEKFFTDILKYTYNSSTINKDLRTIKLKDNPDCCDWLKAMANSKDINHFNNELYKFVCDIFTATIAYHQRNNCHNYSFDNANFTIVNPNCIELAQNKIQPNIDSLDGYKLVNVTGDENCGFYAILQATNPQNNYARVEENDANWLAAAELRQEMFPSGPLSAMVTADMDADTRQQHYLPLDTFEARDAIFRYAQSFDRQVIIINTVNDEMFPSFMTLSDGGEIIPQQSFKDALASAGTNPIILHYTPGHWQTYVTTPTTNLLL